MDEGGAHGVDAFPPPPPDTWVRALLELPDELVNLVLQNAVASLPMLTLYNADVSELVDPARGIVHEALWASRLSTVCKCFSRADFVASRVTLVNPTRSFGRTLAGTHVPRPEHSLRRGNNTWIPEEIELDPIRPTQIWYEVRADAHNSEVIGGFSSSRARWNGGQAGADGLADALTWYAAPHRHDFTFRRNMYVVFDQGEVWRAPFSTPFRLKHAKWHHVNVHLTSRQAAYKIDGVLIASVALNQTAAGASVPRRGHVGMISYASSYTWRNLHIVRPEPVPE